MKLSAEWFYTFSLTYWIFVLPAYSWPKWQHYPFFFFLWSQSWLWVNVHPSLALPLSLWESEQGGTCLTSLRWPLSKANGPDSPRQGAALGCHWPKSLVRSMVRGYKASQCLFELVWTLAESLADVYLQAFDSLAFLHCISGLCPISPRTKSII